MAFREVGVLEVKEVLRLSREKVAKKRIARQLGLDVKTVRRYLELAGSSEVGPAGDLDAEAGPGRCEPEAEAAGPQAKTAEPSRDTTDLSRDKSETSQGGSESGSALTVFRP